MIKLIGDRVAIAIIADPDKIGSLYVPDIAKERSDQGIVKYVGPNVKTLQPGDYVLFSGYSGTTVQFDDQEGVLVILREPFVVCKLGDVVTPIKGLYFKEHLSIDILRSELRNILATYSDDLEERLLGWFSRNIPYFEAPYEVVVNLVAEAWRNTDLAKSIALLKPGEPGRKREAANPDISFDEMSQWEDL